MIDPRLVCWIALALAGSTVANAADPAAIVDTRGPVKNAGMVVKVDQEGVQALGYSWNPPPAKTSWTAQWTGNQASPIPNSAADCVRKEFVLDQEPARVTAWIACENYLLFVNGQPASRGAADTGRDFKGPVGDWRFYDCRDLTAFFQQGRNAIAAELLGCDRWRFEARVEYPDGRTVTIASDPTWKTMVPGYLKTVPVPVELRSKLGSVQRSSATVFDAAAEPVGWQLSGFDDSGWAACSSVNAPPEHWILNELPPLMEVRYPYFDLSAATAGVTVPDHPFTAGHPVIVNGDGEFSVHFDKIMSGRCGIAVKGCAGAEIYLLVSETKEWKGRVYQLHVRDGLQYFESRDYAALGTIHVLVRHASAPIEIRDISADFLSQPVEYRGSFLCSDPSLNTLWKSGRWSTQICMITHHLDSPMHQEPISDYGDYLIEDLVNYAALGTNFSLARQDLRKWAWVMERAHYQTFHTSYLFAWLQSLLNYYDYTGDRHLIEELSPNVHGLIAQFTSYLGKNGIVSQAPNYMFMDWVTIHDDTNPEIKFAAHHPPAVIGQGYMTALFYRGLADAIRVAELTGDRAHADHYARLRAQIGAAYQQELWNPVRGQYRDGKPFVTSIAPAKWLPADVAMESFSVQNNSLAVLEDVAPPGRQTQIIGTMVQNENWEVTPYFMHFVFEAYAHAGLFGKYALAKLHEYRVVAETQTVREMGPEKGDYSHGWIASPTYQMSSKILGVMPTSPGFATFAIRPTFCDLAFARGTVPSPRGDIGVDWWHEPNRVVLKVLIPPGTRAILALPVGLAANPQLTCDGRRVKAARMEQSLEWPEGPGSYTFVATGL